MASFDNAVILHHIGFVVESIEKDASTFASSLALEWDGKIIYDPLQAARVSFFRLPGQETPMLELIEPAGTQSPVKKFLSRGGGLHHLCYEVDSLSKQLDYAKSNHDIIVSEPVPAVAFGGRRIAWVYAKSKILLEYLERHAPQV